MTEPDRYHDGRGERRRELLCERQLDVAGARREVEDQVWGENCLTRLPVDYLTRLPVDYLTRLPVDLQSSSPQSVSPSRAQCSHFHPPCLFRMDNRE